MKQIFIFGASIVYGVGAESLGWADLIKQKLHTHMYGPHGVGEKYEVYNLAKPGAEAAFVIDHLEQLQQVYSQGSKTMAILSIGLNNAKAVKSPNNFVSTLDEYQAHIRQLLTQMKTQFHHLICLGYTPVDESKTNPKQNPISGNISYFNNQRIQQFDKVFHQLCDQLNLTFIDFDDLDHQQWRQDCLYQDGVHPNQTGHQLIFEKVWPLVNKFVET